MHDQWEDWYTLLQNNARSIGFWETIDPNKPDHESDLRDAPPIPNYRQIAAHIAQYRQHQGMEDMTLKDICQLEFLQYKNVKDEYDLYLARSISIEIWISNTLHPLRYKIIRRSLEERHDNQRFSLRQFIREIQITLAPVESTIYRSTTRPC